MLNSAWLEALWPWRYRDLVWQFARREVLGRYRGSWLGVGWTVLAPLAMLSIYTLVFRDVFGARWPASRSGSSIDFALNLYAGLVFFSWAADLLSRAPRLVLEQPNLVTKVVFPLPMLAWSACLSSGFQALVSLGIWLAACMWSGYVPHAGWLALPLIVLGFVPWLLGLCWILCSLGVYLRDLSQLVSLAVSGLMFLSPVFYPVQALPVWLQPVVALNPLTAPIEAVRAVVLAGQSPTWSTWALSSLCGVLVCVSGLALMRRIQSGFADVL